MPNHNFRYLLLLAIAVLVPVARVQATSPPSIEHTVSVTAIVQENPITRAGVAWHSSVQAPILQDLGQTLSVDVRILGLQSKPRRDHVLTVVVDNEQGRHINQREATTDNVGAVSVPFPPLPAPGLYRILVTDITSGWPLVIEDQPEVYVRALPSVPADRTQPDGDPSISPVSLPTSTPTIIAPLDIRSNSFEQIESISLGLSDGPQRLRINPG